MKKKEAYIWIKLDQDGEKIKNLFDSISDVMKSDDDDIAF